MNLFKLLRAGGKDHRADLRSYPMVLVPSGAIHPEPTFTLELNGSRRFSRIEPPQIHVKLHLMFYSHSTDGFYSHFTDYSTFILLMIVHPFHSHSTPILVIVLPFYW